MNTVTATTILAQIADYRALIQGRAANGIGDRYVDKSTMEVFMNQVNTYLGYPDPSLKEIYHKPGTDTPLQIEVERISTVQYLASGLKVYTVRLLTIPEVDEDLSWAVHGFNAELRVDSMFHLEDTDIIDFNSIHRIMKYAF